jgi:hypothetical protein
LPVPEVDCISPPAYEQRQTLQKKYVTPHIGWKMGMVHESVFGLALRAFTSKICLARLSKPESSGTLVQRSGVQQYIYVRYNSAKMYKKMYILSIFF